MPKQAARKPAARKSRDPHEPGADAMSGKFKQNALGVKTKRGHRAAAAPRVAMTKLPTIYLTRENFVKWIKHPEENPGSGVDRMYHIKFQDAVAGARDADKALAKKRGVSIKTFGGGTLAKMRKAALEVYERDIDKYDQTAAGRVICPGRKLCVKGHCKGKCMTISLGAHKAMLDAVNGDEGHVETQLLCESCNLAKKRARRKYKETVTEVLGVAKPAARKPAAAKKPPGPMKRR